MSTLAEKILASRKDPGFQKAAAEYAKELAIAERRLLCREAFEAGARDRNNLERKFAEGEGVWWNEMAPLKPAERRIVINQLKINWGLMKDPYAVEVADVVPTPLAVEKLATE